MSAVCVHKVRKQPAVSADPADRMGGCCVRNARKVRSVRKQPAVPADPADRVGGGLGSCHHVVHGVPDVHKLVFFIKHTTT